MDGDNDGSREGLKSRLFRKCDRDGDGFLNKREMRELAEDVGFEGSDQDWKEEYELLCAEHHLDANQGIPKDIIMNVLEDKSELGLYCTDQEIRQLLDKAIAAKAAAGGGNKRGSDDFLRIFFAGANFSTEESILKSTFEEAGRVEEFTLFRLQDGRSMGMGRVLYATHEDAKNALSTLHQREVDGRQMMVQVDQRGEDDADGEGKGKRKGKGKDAGGRDDGKGYYAGKDDFKGKGKGGRGQEWGWGEDGGPRGRYGKGGGDPGDYRTMFFAGASFDSSANFLRKTFQQAGRISQFWLFQERNGYSRGMGVVQYETPREASRAVQQFSGAEIGGRALYAKLDDRGLLQQAFQQGQEYTEWDGGWAGGNSKGYGGYEGGKGGWSKGYNSKGYGGYDGGYDKGGYDKGGYNKGGYDKGGYAKGGKAGPKGGGYDAQEGDQSNRVYFSGVPFKAPTSSVQEYFAVFGEIRSFTIFKRPDGASRGMGVCVYQSSNAATAAMRYGIIIDGRSIFMQEDTSFKGPDDEYDGYKGGGGPKGGGGYQGGGKGGGKSWGAGTGYEDPPPQVDPNRSVFFRNVPFETTEKFLKERFGRVGAIKNFMLFTTPDGRSKGMGVVEFGSPLEAERAYNEIHNMPVSGRPITVDYYHVQL